MLLFFSFLLIIWWVACVMVWPHPPFAQKKDPEAVYYANSLLLANSGKAQHTHHPGTLVQLVGVPFVKLLGVTFENAFEGERFRTFSRLWQGIVLFVLLAVWVRIYWQFRGSANANVLAVIYLIFVCNVDFFRHALIFKPESFYFVLALPVCMALLGRFERSAAVEHRTPTARTVSYLVAGSVLGVLTTIKYNLIPVAVFSLLLAPFLERRPFRDSLPQLAIGALSAVLSFTALSAFFSDNFLKLCGWVLLLLLSSGVHGTGDIDGGFLSPSELAFQIFSLDRPQFGLTYFVFAVGMGLGILLFRKSWQTGVVNSHPQTAIQPALPISLVVSLSLVFFMLCKHPYGLHYILSGSVILILFALVYFRNFHCPGRVVNGLVAVLALSTLIAAHNAMSDHISEYRQSHSAKEKIDAYFDRNRDTQFVFDAALPHPVTMEVIATFYASPLRPLFRSKYPTVGIEISGSRAGFERYEPGAIIFQAWTNRTN